MKNGLTEQKERKNMKNIVLFDENNNILTNQDNIEIE